MFVLFLFLTFIIVVVLFPFNYVLNLLNCIILLRTSIYLILIGVHLCNTVNFNVYLVCDLGGCFLVILLFFGGEVFIENQQT